MSKDVKMEKEQKREDPTLERSKNFNAEDDALDLYKAMHGYGTKENDIIKILGRRTRDQRKDIAEKYITIYGKTLEEKLSSDLSFNFKTLCVESLLSPAEYDAMQLNKAINRPGTDETALIEIICSRTNKELTAVKAAYQTMFNRDLTRDVAEDTSKWFKRLLVSCLQAKRPERSDVDRQMARREARELHDAGEGKFFGTDESVFNRIMTNRSYAQLRATFQEYFHLDHHGIEHAIRSEMSGDLEDGLLAIVRVTRGKPAYFARQLHDAMKRSGTDDDTVMRVVLSRCEVDMVQIKEEYRKEYRQTLADKIRSDTSGDYCKMLLTLIGENQI